MQAPALLTLARTFSNRLALQEFLPSFLSSFRCTQDKLFFRVLMHAGWLFGGKVAAEFNAVNGLELICRAHQLVQVRLFVGFFMATVKSPCWALRAVCVRWLLFLIDWPTPQPCMTAKRDFIGARPSAQPCLIAAALLSSCAAPGPTCTAGGPEVHVPGPLPCDRLVCAQLLLPLRQRGLHALL